MCVQDHETPEVSISTVNQGLTWSQDHWREGMLLDGSSPGIVIKTCYYTVDSERVHWPGVDELRIGQRDHKREFSFLTKGR